LPITGCTFGHQNFSIALGRSKMTDLQMVQKQDND